MKTFPFQFILVRMYFMYQTMLNYIKNLLRAYGLNKLFTQINKSDRFTLEQAYKDFVDIQTNNYKKR